MMPDAAPSSSLARFTGPAQDCGGCDRLCDFRHENRRKFPDKHNAPVPSFGSLDASLLIVGLAPGLRGANFSGRPFTGDYAGDLLYTTLLRHGYAKGNYGAHVGDGLELIGTRITNAVRCVPPENKPTPAEMRSCLPYLVDEIGAMPNLRAILTLGQISHTSVLRALGLRVAAFKFAHGAIHRSAGKPAIVNTYHSSRYNVNTGRLTPEMFDQVFTGVHVALQD